MNSLSAARNFDGLASSLPPMERFSRLPPPAVARATPARCGFTLVELLVVMAILVIVIGLLTPAITTIIGGSQVTQSTQLVGDQFAFARQIALARNQSVEVRIYQYADSSVPGETAGNATSGKYRAFQFFGIRDTGLPVPLGKMQRLQNTILIDKGTGNPTLTSIIGSSSAAANTWPEYTTSAQQTVSLPGIGTTYNCVAFRFLSGGGTNLSSAQNWFLTLHHLTDGDGLNKAPGNFGTIEIDASSGHIRTFRS